MTNKCRNRNRFNVRVQSDLKVTMIKLYVGAVYFLVCSFLIITISFDSLMTKCFI